MATTPTKHTAFLSATFTAVLVLVFPAWVLALSIILPRAARQIPKDMRLPARVGVAMLNPLGTYSDKEREP